MKKIFFALCIALSVFACSSMSAFAAVCSNAPDGVHHFTAHKPAGSIEGKEGGTHQYLYGYDHNEKPIYKNDCKLVLIYRTCLYICQYCNVEEGSAQHLHYVITMHSIDHD